jgi:pimeloyl-ACP methyl ester carboxylesterase
MKSLPLSALALMLCAAPALAQDAKPSAQVTRADLARAYQRFERALQSAPKLSPARAANLNRSFDRATVAFFGGAYARAIQSLDGLSESLEDRAPPGAGFALRVYPARWVRGVGAPRLSATRIYPTTRSLGELRLRVYAGPRLAAEQPLSFSAAGELSPVTLGVRLRSLPPGQYRLELGSSPEDSVPVGRWTIVPKPLEARRRALEVRLSKLRGVAQGSALQTCAGRVRLLDQPREADLATVLLDVNALASDLEAEVLALERGENPYRSKGGDHWRALDHKRRAIPYRVLAPQRALAEGEPLAVVIAFHGAGGDENMFLYGYGSGELGRQAKRLGFLTVTPRSESFLRDPSAFDALLSELERDYRIDPARIYLLGHSMGTGAVARILATRAERIAAAVCFSGASGGGKVPTLSIRGSLDPFGGFTGRAKTGEKIVSRSLSGRGHTLLVGERLGEALEWLGSHERAASSEPLPAPEGKRWF